MHPSPAWLCKTLKSCGFYRAESTETPGTLTVERPPTGSRGFSQQVELGSQLHLSQEIKQCASGNLGPGLDGGLFRSLVLSHLHDCLAIVDILELAEPRL